MVVPVDDDAAEQRAEARIEAALRDLLPFSEGALERRPLPELRWDTDALLADPAGAAWPEEPELRLCARPAVYGLDRASVGGLGGEGEVWLGWRAGDAIAGGADVGAATLGRPPPGPPLPRGATLSTESDAAAARAPISLRSALWRLFGYARPYVWPIAAAFLLASLSQRGRYGRAYLIKPIFDDVIAPAQALREAGGSLPFELGELVPGARSEAAPRRRRPSSTRARMRARLEEISEPARPDPLRSCRDRARHAAGRLFARDYLVAWVLGRIDLDMKIELCGRLLALPLRFHRDRSRGDLLARIDGRRGHGAGRARAGVRRLRRGGRDARWWARRRSCSCRGSSRS